MRKHLPMLSAVVLALALQSCGTYTTLSSKTASFVPNQIIMNIDKSDIQFLGEVKVDIDVKHCFGVRIKRINGIPFNRNKQTMVKLYGKQDIAHSPLMQYAMAGAVEKYPEADCYIPVYSKHTRRGARTHQEWIIKAYKYKF